MSDIIVSILMIIILSCHITAIIIGYKKQNITLIVSYLNLAIAVSFLFFWGINVNQYNIEFVELALMCLEACIIISALFYINKFNTKTMVKVVNYIGFGIHLLVTTGMLYYILTFKFSTLF